MAPDAPTILEVEHLEVAFGPLTVLHDLSFRVRRGESVAVIGPNGSGKTVLFQALVGALAVRGTIRWAPNVRIGYVPQKLDLERDLPITGYELMAARHRVTRSVVDISALLRRVALEGVAERPIGTLSGGQFQRLLVALALVDDPDVLLLDEFTAGVDAAGQERLTELVHRLQAEQRLTILEISHDLSVVLRGATNVLCLSFSRAWFGPPRKILTPELLHEVYGTPVEFHIHGE